MVRGLADGDATAEMPISGFFRTAIAERATVTPEQVGREIWAAIDDGAPQGAAVKVGADHNAV